MNKYAPEHVEKFCVQDMIDSIYNQLNEVYQDNYKFTYKLKCDCGNECFEVYKDRHPSIFAKCVNCNRIISVYDLQYYPAASKLNMNFNKQQVIINGHKSFFVYVVYEYDDEFEFEDDVDFNPNDITWAKVFVYDQNVLQKILDDETA